MPKVGIARFAFLLFLFFSACKSPEVVSKKSSSNGASLVAVRVTPDADWDTVLQLGSSGAPDAKSKLAAISKGSLPSSELATVMLENWKDDINTFESDSAIGVHLQDISWTELKAASPSQTVGTFLVNVKVNEKGQVTESELLNPTDEVKLNKLLESAALASLYCPAKPGDKYVTSDSMYTFTVD